MFYIFVIYQYIIVYHAISLGNLVMQFNGQSDWQKMNGTYRHIFTQYANMYVQTVQTLLAQNETYSAWVISHVPMFHITQPWSVYSLLDGYFFRWCPLYSQVMGHLPTPVLCFLSKFRHDLPTTCAPRLSRFPMQRWLLAPWLGAGCETQAYCKGPEAL